MSKPILALAYNNTNDQREVCFIDSDLEDTDKEDSDKEDSDKEDSGEEQELDEDKMEECYLSSICNESLSSSLPKGNIDYHQKHASDFRLGIVLPPPELV